MKLHLLTGNAQAMQISTVSAEPSDQNKISIDQYFGDVHQYLNEIVAKS